MSTHASPGEEREASSPSPPTRARLYQSARTAHFERAAELPPALLLFDGRRYDFDETLAHQAGAVQAGTFAAARILGKSHVDVLEVNEPSAIGTVRRAAVSLAWLRLKSLFGAHRPLVVTYAIDNSDPFRAASDGPPRQRLVRRVDSALARYVWWECDRIAFGTSAAAETYATAFGKHRRPLATAIIPALPAPCPCAMTSADRPPRVLFLGALVARKGFPQVVEAWPHVVARRPDAELAIVGKGALASLADHLAAGPSVHVVIDPPRSEIHVELRSASVLVLPSQRSGRWREQVGLPIVEGLAHGCSIVTTDETGLAGWLAAHGHRVLRADDDADALATALIDALDERRAPRAIQADLPSVDGRLAADAWMFGDSSV